MLRDVFAGFQCQLKNKLEYRAILLRFPLIFITLIIIMCLPPKLWGRYSPALSCDSGNHICSLGQFSSAVRKRENVSKLLSTIVWTDDDVETDRQLIDLVRDSTPEVALLPT